MKSDFESLVNVFIEHEYFNKKRFTGLVVTIDNESRRLMLNNGLLCKSHDNSLRILFDKNFAGNSRTKTSLLKEGLTLQFYLTLSDIHFYNYTELSPADISRSVFYFDNSINDKEEPGKDNVLHAGAVVSYQDLMLVKQIAIKGFNKPFGWLVLKLHENLPGSYYIRFSARSTYWKYIVVSDHLKQLDKPAVIDTLAKEFFDGPANITLPDKRDALSFVSRAPITLSDSGSKRFQLVENYDPVSGRFKVVQSALPLPDFQVISSVTGKTATPNHYFSEIFIY